MKINAAKKCIILYSKQPTHDLAIFFCFFLLSCFIDDILENWSYVSLIWYFSNFSPVI